MRGRFLEAEARKRQALWGRRAHPAPAAGPALPAPRGARCSFRVLRVALRSEATRPAAAAGTLSGRPGLGWLHGTAAGGSQDANRSESRLQTERQVLLWRVVGGTGLAFCVARGGAGRGVTAGRRRKPPLRARRATHHAAGTQGTVGRFLLTARRVPSPPFVSWEDEVECQPVYSALYAPWGKAVCDLCKTFLERALGVRSRGGLSPSAAWPRRDGAGWHRAPRGRLCSVLRVQDAGQGRRAAGSCGCWWRRTCPHHARGSTPEPEMEVTGESEPPSRCGQSSLEVLWGEGGVAGPVVALLRVQTTGPRGGFDLAPPRAHEPQGRREAEAGKGKASWSSRSHSRRGRGPR